MSVKNPYKHTHIPSSISSDLQCILEKLRPFQREAFDFATGARNRNDVQLLRNDFTQQQQPHGRILLADEMGLGKTVTSLAIMTSYMEEWPLLVLCPASLRHTWPNEIEKFLPTLPASSIYVVSGFDDTTFIKRRKQLKIVVATYSLLQTRSAAARVLQEMDFQCVIADESHNLKEKSSQRCQLAFPLLQKAKRLVLLSGTPALAKPVELWSQVHCIAPNLFGSYSSYTKQYCNAKRGRFGWDVSGLSNAEELNQKLKLIMVRRLKSDVLHELPPKQRSIVPIKVTNASAIKQCRELIQDLNDTRVSVEELVGQDANDAHFEHRRLLMQAYQSSGISKASAVADYLLDWLQGAGTQKILVFAHHKQVMDTLENAVAKKYKGVGHIRIDGSVAANDRAARVRKFQTSPQIRVAILSMTAAGVGLTLTAASSVLFAELHWTPGVIAQAEDRCHRIGQPNAVNVMYCVNKDESLSVDTRLWCMLGRKVGTLGRVIDGCKTASMNATETSADSTLSTVGGQSVEEELQSFFAEASASTAKQSKSAAVPVKGSILSFFKPSANKQEESSSTLTASSNTKPSSASKRPAKEQHSTAARPKDVKSPPKLIEWSCSMCTYDNSKHVSDSAVVSCEMCGTCHCQNEATESQDERKIAAASGPAPRSSTKAKRKAKNTVVDLLGINSNEYAGKRKASSEVIVLDSSDDESETVTPPPCTKKARLSSSSASSKTIATDAGSQPAAKSSEVFVIDVDAPSSSRSIVTPASLQRKRAPPSVLYFAVSKNSGRVSIHSAVTGDALNANFDIDQLITEETSDALLNGEVKRASSKARSVVVSERNIHFRKDAVAQVVRSLNLSREKKTSRKTREQCCDEIKHFVRSYLTLREVEKKALKEWIEPVSSVTLKQTVAQIMTSSTTESCTERYAGGAKERARENAKAGNASALDSSVLAGTACAWCAGALPDASFAHGVNCTYCSQECAEKGRLKRGGMYASTRVRAQVFGLEGGVCRKCGIDAHALYTRIAALEPPERLSALINAKWQLPRTGVALDRLLQSPKEGDFWQADHIQAVAEGGGGCGLDNLQTLCTPCHRFETEKLRSRLRLAGGAKNDDSNQMDIRSAFLSQGGKGSSNKE